MYTFTRLNRMPQTCYGARANWPIPDDYFRPFAEMVNSPMRTAVKETETAYLFDAALPGYEPGEIDVSVQDSVLTVSAEHKETAEHETSFASRAIRRSFTLDGVDEENIGAQYKNGVLRVTLPKAKAPEVPAPRKIEVQ